LSKISDRQALTYSYLQSNLISPVWTLIIFYLNISFKEIRAQLYRTLYSERSTIYG